MSGIGFSVDVGGLYDSLTGASSARQYKYTRRLQKHDQEFQKMMSDTAHQREIQDLKNAGLNPILSAMGGSGAIGTGASSASVSMQDNKSGGMELNPIEITSAIKQQKNVEQDTKTKKAEEKYYEKLSNKTDAEKDSIRQNITMNTPDETTAEQDTKYNNSWIGRNIVNPTSWFLRKIGLTGGGVVNTATTAYGAHKISKAMNKPKTTVKNMYNSKGKFTGSTTTVKR